MPPPGDPPLRTAVLAPLGTAVLAPLPRCPPARTASIPGARTASIRVLRAASTSVPQTARLGRIGLCKARRVTAESKDRGRHLLDRVLAGVPSAESPLRHVKHLPERSARTAEWPSWVPAEVVDAYAARGVREPWVHQVEGADAVRSGQHVVVATGTASGKSMVYQLPVLSRLLEDRTATALYLSPTKALGADQLRAVEELGLGGIRAAGYDGDTPKVDRDWVRAYGRWVFTNPDMLHLGVLPAHSRWARFFRSLRYVVVDECHTYRGVFGSHVALLLRRLRRIAHHYGADPVFVLASATVSDPGDLGERLTGARCRAITDDGSPRGARTVALWEPPLLEEVIGENGAPVRRSAGSETARIMTELVIEDARTLAFIRSRRGVEVAALSAQRALAEVDSSLPDRVKAYRGGYLPEDRRALERALLAGDLRAVATTNALELGVDIAGLDAVIVAGYPGTLASFWQQAGRAGRDGEGALVVFVARDDPLDTYLVHHPPAVLERPVEATVLDPANPYVLEPHLACAASELPLKEECFDAFGGAPAAEAVHALTADGVLRRRPHGWYWTERERPHRSVELRGSGGSQVAVVEGDSGRMLGTVDPDSACATVHPGAVYLHQGESFVVDELDLNTDLALVHAESPDWTTSARESVDISVLRTVEHRQVGPDVAVCLGDVEVTSQVVGYLRTLPSGRVLDQVPLDLPARKLVTRAVWYTISPELLCGSAPGRRAGSGAHPRCAACRRARGDRPATAVRYLRSMGHRRCLHRHARRHRGGDGVRARRSSGRGRIRRSRLCRAVPMAGRDAGSDRFLRVPGWVPVLRPVAEVRERQRTAGQGGGGGCSRRGVDRGPARRIGWAARAASAGLSAIRARAQRGGRSSCRRSCSRGAQGAVPMRAVRSRSTWRSSACCDEVSHVVVLVESLDEGVLHEVQRRQGPPADLGLDPPVRRTVRVGGRRHGDPAAGSVQPDLGEIGQFGGQPISAGGQEIPAPVGNGHDRDRESQRAQGDGGAVAERRVDLDGVDGRPGREQQAVRTTGPPGGHLVGVGPEPFLPVLVHRHRTVGFAAVASDPPSAHRIGPGQHRPAARSEADRLDPQLDPVVQQPGLESPDTADGVLPLIRRPIHLYSASLFSSARGSR